MINKLRYIKGIVQVGFILFALLLVAPFTSCDPDDDDCKDDNCDTCTYVYKPNIYLYPQENINLDVALTFPKGGKVVVSEPNYGDGWSVYVDTTGLIDSTYEYLFYESQQPHVWQSSKGWCIEKAQMEEFFDQNLTEYGFAGNEIEDFNEYWIPRLKDYAYYEIYPQEKELINTVIELSISEQPDNVQRLFYLIRGNNKKVELIEPQVANQFLRQGFYVTEWGVITE